MKPDEIAILASVAKARHNTLPVLQNLKLDKTGVGATDLDIYAHYKVKGLPELLLPASEVKARGLQGAIDAQGYIIVNKDDDFPVFPEPKTGSKAVQIDGEIFRHLLKASVVASDDDTRPILTGVQLDGSDKKVTICGTDSYHLYGMELERESYDFKLIIPAKFIQLLKRTRLTEWQMLFGEDVAVFSSGNWTLTTRLIQGNYPDWKKLVPKKAETKIDVTVDQIKQIMKLKPQAGSLNFFEDHIEYMNAQDVKETAPLTKVEKGRGSVELGAVKIVMPLKGNADGIVSLNGRYLLALAETNTLTLYIGEPLAPVIVQG